MQKKILFTHLFFSCAKSREKETESEGDSRPAKSSMLPAALSTATRPCGGGGGGALPLLRRQQATTTTMVASTSMPASSSLSSSSSFLAPRRRRTLSLLPSPPRAIGKGSSFGEEEEPSKESIEMRK